MSDKPTQSNGLSYRDAGVDIDAGDDLQERLDQKQSDDAPGRGCCLGGFGGLFDLRGAGFTDPILVAATDGVARS